jgi:hypothetical protein
MAVSLSARDLMLLKRVSEGLLQQLPSDWLRALLLQPAWPGLPTLDD